MASRFVLTAQLNVLPPNTTRIVNQLNQQLRGVQANVNVNVNPQTTRNLRNLNNQLKTVDKNAKSAATSAEAMGVSAAQAAKRFGGFSIVTATLFNLTRAIKDSFRAAVEFEKELNKIRQVTGNSIRDLSGLANEIERLSKGLGVSSEQLLQASRILSQTGLAARDVQTALEALAKTDLAPTFGDIIRTTEGSIAIFRQFGIQANELEGALGSINAVAGRFAVESEDIIAAVRRTGGAFAAAGGNLNELIALFTSVRATTRESAESIATGFRTIFTRLQRVRTINFLEDLGIQLRDVEGQFVGPLEAIRRLSTALEQLQGTDPRFAQITEELGGFRQVSKVIPLVQEFATAQQALAVAQQGTASLSIDAAKAQDTLANQIQKTKEEFAALIRSIANDSAFRSFIQVALKLASAFIEVADSIKPLIPLITAVGAIGLGRATRGFASGFLGEIGRPSKFASGGKVPGSGNRDTVPALLTPGEFVIRKQAVQAIGTDTLQDINKFNKGGIVQRFERGGVVNEIKAAANSKGEIGANNLVNLSPEAKRFIAENSGNFNSGSPIGSTQLRLKGNRKKILEALAIEQTATQQTVNQNKGIEILSDFGGVFFEFDGGDEDSANGSPTDVEATYNQVIRASRTKAAQTKLDDFAAKKDIDTSTARVFASPRLFAINDNVRERFGRVVNRDRIVKNLDKTLGDDFDFPGKSDDVPLERLLSNSGIANVRGQLFEAMIRRVSQTFIDNSKDSVDEIFDFTSTNPALRNLLSSKVDAAIPLDAKITKNRDSEISLLNKAVRHFDTSDFRVKKFASGGAASGTDSVPALLTPGEFVLNKEAVKKIGIGTAEKLNNVQKFQSGGLVGGVFGRDGNQGLLLAGSLVLPTLISQFDSLGDSTKRILEGFTTLGAQIFTFITLLRNIPNNAQVIESFNRAGVKLESDLKTFDEARAQLTNARQIRRDIDVDFGAGRISRTERNNLLTARGATISDIKQYEKAVDGADDALKKQVKTSYRARDAAQSLERTLLGISVAAGIAQASAGLLQQRGLSQLQAGDRSGVGQAQFVTGGALAGAATGAIAGASIGSLITPVYGTAIGAGVGAVGGAIVGVATSIQEANRILENVEFNENLEKFTDVITKANNNLITTFRASPQVEIGVGQLTERLITSTGEDRESARGAIRNSLVSLDQFLTNAARASGSMEVFTKQNEEAIEFLALWTDTPIDEVNSRFEELISTNRELNIKNSEFAQSLAKVTREIQGITDFGRSLNSASESAAQFDSQIETIVSSLSGIPTVSRRNRSEFISSGGLDDRQFRNVVTGLGSAVFDTNFNNQRGTELGNTLADVNELRNRLPDILTNVATTDPLAENILDTLEKGLSGVGRDIRDRIIETVERDVIGAENKGGNLLEAINKDVIGLSDQLIASYEPLREVFVQAEEELTKQVNQYSQAVAQYTQAVIDGAERHNKVLDLIQQREEFAAAATGRPVNTGLIRALGISRERAFTGGLSVQGAATQLENAQSRLQQGGLSTKEIKKLSKEAGEAERALKFFANASLRTADEQLELRQKLEVAQAKQRIVNTATFGSEAEVQQLGQNIVLAGFAAGQGINAVPRNLRGGIEDFLGSLPKEFEIFGSTAGKLLEDFRTQYLVSKGADPKQARQIAKAQTTETERLIDFIKNQFSEAIDAQNKLNRIVNTNLNTLITKLDTRFREFRDALQDNLRNAESNRLQRELGSVTTNREEIRSNIQALSGLGDAATNTEQLNTIRANLPTALRDISGEEERLRQARLAGGIDGDGLFAAAERFLTGPVAKELEVGVRIRKFLSRFLTEDTINKLDSVSDRNDVLRVTSDILKESGITDKELGADIQREVLSRVGDAEKFTGGFDPLEVRKIIFDSVRKVGGEAFIDLESSISTVEEARNAINDIVPGLGNSVEKMKEINRVLQQIGDTENIDSLFDQFHRLNTEAGKLAHNLQGLELSGGEGAANGGEGMATGGIVRGPGGPRSDVIPLMVSNGEAVLNARAVKQLGTDFVHRANRGMLGFAQDGGIFDIYNSGSIKYYRELRRRHGLPPLDRTTPPGGGLSEESQRFNMFLAMRNKNTQADIAARQQAARQATVKQLAVRNNIPRVDNNVAAQAAQPANQPQTNNNATDVARKGNPLNLNFDQLEKISENLSKLNGLAVTIEGKVDVNVTFADAQLGNIIEAKFKEATEAYLNERVPQIIDQTLEQRPAN